MKAKDCLERGKKLGLVVVGDATESLTKDAMYIFTTSTVGDEVSEMFEELREMDIHKKMNIDDALDRIRSIKGD